MTSSREAPASEGGRYRRRSDPRTDLEVGHYKSEQMGAAWRQPCLRNFVGV